MTLSSDEIARLRTAHGVKPVTEKAEPVDFVKLIRKYRMERHWSMETLARKAGMNAVRIGSYERGDRQATAATLAEIFDALGYEFRVVPKGTADVDSPARQAAQLRYIADRIEHGNG